MRAVPPDAKAQASIFLVDKRSVPGELTMPRATRGAHTAFRPIRFAVSHSRSAMRSPMHSAMSWALET